MAANTPSASSVSSLTHKSMAASTTVLMVGIACIDTILEVDDYPAENTKIRAVNHRISRGGNAANSSVILSQLGHHVAFMASLGSHASSSLVTSELKDHKVDISLCEYDDASSIPMSFITTSKATKSRTIIHSRNTPELSERSIQSLPQSSFCSRIQWIHFEGRNVNITIQHIQWIMKESSRFGSSLTISIELERNDSLEPLIPFGDVLFISKEFILSRTRVSERNTLASPECYLRSLLTSGRCKPNVIMVVPWGSIGAYAMDHYGTLYFSEAIDLAVSSIRDSVGAGDTFIAAFIHARRVGASIQGALMMSNPIAALKLQRTGFTLSLNNQQRRDFGVVTPPHTSDTPNAIIASRL